MKIINLYKTNTAAMTVTPEQVAELGIIAPTVNDVISKVVDMNKVSVELEIARHNGAQIIWSTSCMENFLEDFLLDYFTGGASQKCKMKDIMQREILQASFFSFNSKIQISGKILNEEELLTGKNKNKLQSHLAKIQKWRNAFAHGDLVSDGIGNIKLSYYSGGLKSIELNDEFFLNIVDKTFTDCFGLVNEIIKNLNVKTKK